MTAIIDRSRFETEVVEGLTFTPLGPLLGAEVSGADLTRPLEAGEVAAIRGGLNRYKVLVFRDQDISHADHVRFGRYFGELEGHPVTTTVPGYREILHIEAADGLKLTDDLLPIVRPANKWHTDVTFREKPFVRRHPSRPDPAAAGRGHDLRRYGGGLCRPAARAEGPAVAAEG